MSEDRMIEELGLSPAGTELMRSVKGAVMKFIETPDVTPVEALVAIGGVFTITLNRMQPADAKVAFNVFVQATRDTLREAGIEVGDGVINTQMRASLLQMLDTYWGDGDGEPPPQFIIDAKKAVSAHG